MMSDSEQIKRLQKTIEELEEGMVWPDSQLRLEAVRFAQMVDPENLITKARVIYKFLKGTE